MVDLLLLRPIGLVSLTFSTVLFIVPVLPLTLLTRPTEIKKPFNEMIPRARTLRLGASSGQALGRLEPRCRSRAPRDCPAAAAIGLPASGLPVAG
jgi:hypothetical protein